MARPILLLSQYTEDVSSKSKDEYEVMAHLSFTSKCVTQLRMQHVLFEPTPWIKNIGAQA